MKKRIVATIVFAANNVGDNFKCSMQPLLGTRPECKPECDLLDRRKSVVRLCLLL